MGRYDDIDPQDIDPETNRPYAGYSSPSLDTDFHDNEMDVDDKAEAGRVKRAFFHAMQESLGAGEITAVRYGEIAKLADDLGDESWLRLAEVMAR